MVSSMMKRLKESLSAQCTMMLSKVDAHAGDAHAMLKRIALPCKLEGKYMMPTGAANAIRGYTGMIERVAHRS